MCLGKHFIISSSNKTAPTAIPRPSNFLILSLFYNTLSLSLTAVVTAKGHCLELFRLFSYSGNLATSIDRRTYLSEMGLKWQVGEKGIRVRWTTTCVPCQPVDRWHESWNWFVYDAASEVMWPEHESGSSDTRESGTVESSLPAAVAFPNGHVVRTRGSDPCPRWKRCVITSTSDSGVILPANGWQSITTRVTWWVKKKTKNTDVQQTAVFMPFEGKLTTIKGKYPCSRSINTEVQSFAVGMKTLPVFITWLVLLLLLL